MGTSVALTISSVDMLNEIYTSPQVTKHFMGNYLYWPVMPGSIVTQATEHPQYSDKRKALAAAFFKQKLIAMTEIIKDVTLKEIRLLQKYDLSKYSLATMTLNLQGKIIINCAVGKEYADVELDWEGEQGTEKMSVIIFLERLFSVATFRLFDVTAILFPLLIWTTFTPKDLRFARNVKKMRAQVQKIIDERRARDQD